MTTESVESEAGDRRYAGLREELTELLSVLGDVGPGQLGDLLIERATHLNATDVHLDPMTEGLRVRLRIDGELHEVMHLPADAASHVVSRIKVLAGLDITERRRPQDGRLPGKLGTEHDIRVSSGPTIHGERLVLRLTSSSEELTLLDNLGFLPQQLESVRRSLEHPSGMMLVTGPIGSGKSTTVYSALRELNDPRRSVVTIEDPVERRIDGVSQIEIDPSAHLDFADALRGVLRQDANVLMVGEIRDSESAHIASRAALTGTMVLSTLHASDTAAAIEVLRALKIPPLVIADSLKCVITQRLVRRICKESRETYSPDPSVLDTLRLSADDARDLKLTRGVPAECNFHTGYSGRTAVYEVLELSSGLRSAILENAPAQRIRELAAGEGLITLKQATLQKVIDGVTSVEEYLRTE